MAEKKDLQLYVMTGCPYCAKVQRFMDARGITLPIHNITTSEADSAYLVEHGGKRQVPCLFIDGKALYESDDIIDYLGREFA
jgi:glutaredoxin